MVVLRNVLRQVILVICVTTIIRLNWIVKCKPMLMMYLKKLTLGMMAV